MIKRADILWMGGLTVAALLSGVFLSGISPYMIILIPLAFIVGVLLLNNGEICIALVVLTLPLLESKIMSFSLLPVPGARVSNILLLVALVGLLINSTLNLSEVKLASVFYFGSLILLVFAVLRADHVALYAMDALGEEYTPLKFFISYGFMPALRITPLFVIIMTIRKRSDIYRLTTYLALSMVALSISIIGIYFFQVPAGADFSVTRSTIGLELGMHGNNLADFFIIGIPFIFALSLDKMNQHRKWFYLAVLLSLAATALIYSRAAYFIISIAVFAVILITKKYKLLIPALVIGLLITILMPEVIDRALTGFETGDPAEITAGRTDMIWKGIIRETEFNLENFPEKIIFGYGRYGYMALQDFRNQRILGVTHAHNMYLDTLLDAGLIGLGFYLFFFVWMIMKISARIATSFRTEGYPNIFLFTGLLVSIISFLARGLVGSFFLPHLSNTYMYFIIAITFIAFNEKIISEGEKIRIEV